MDALEEMDTAASEGCHWKRWMQQHLKAGCVAGRYAADTGLKAGIVGWKCEANIIQVRLDD